MSARNKLNVMYVNGAFLISAIVGFVFQSWSVFLIAAAVMLIGAVVGGDIRPTSRR